MFACAYSIFGSFSDAAARRLFAHNTVSANLIVGAIHLVKLDVVDQRGSLRDSDVQARVVIRFWVARSLLNENKKKNEMATQKAGGQVVRKKVQVSHV